MNAKRRNFYCLFLIIISSFSVRGQVVINEYSAANLSQFADNNTKYEDWVELYNTSGSAVSIGGYYLSDDSTNNTKYQIPVGTTMAGNGFMRFWASGRNMSVGTHFHTNFKLTQTKSNKEDLVLSNPAGTIIDGLRLTVTQLGHSFGRSTNGAATWKIFTIPTPNSSNNSAISYTDYAARPDATLAAGFYSGTQLVTLTTT